MRDPRFDQNNAYLTAHRNTREFARKDAAKLPDVEAIVSSLAAWCQAILFNAHFVESANDDHRLSDLLTLPPAQSPWQAFHDIADAKQRQLLVEGITALLEGSEHELRNTVAWLFGLALAKGLVDELATVETPTKGLIASLCNLIDSQNLIHSAFDLSLRERLHNCSLARAAILSNMDTWIGDINRNPGSKTFGIEENALNVFVDKWRSHPSIDGLWKDKEVRFHLYFAPLDMIPGILPTDRVAICERLERFDFPLPVHQVLQNRTILHDRDEISALLRVAPICSDEGQTWNGRFLALLVLQTAEAHCYALWDTMRGTERSEDADSAVREAIGATLSSWFEELGRIVMARPDGRFLGPQWLFMKVADERMDRGRRGRIGDRAHEYLWQDDLIEWIVLGLSKAGLTGNDIHGFVEFPDPPNEGELAPAKPASRDNGQTYSRLGALSLMVLVDHRIGNGPAEERRKLIDWVDALLASRDRAFEIEAIGNAVTGNLVVPSCGYLLANVDEPAERWRRSWDLLVEQRRRAQHWQITEDSDALAPSLFLLGVGTSCIDWLLSPSHCRIDKATELWRELFDGARECWLTISVIHLVESIETHISRLFARHPMVFGASAEQQDAPIPNIARAGNNYSELLARDLDLLGGDDAMLTICCLNAHYNGATPAIMDHVLKRNSGRIDAILQQFEEWQLHAREVHKRTDIVESLAKLRAEIEQLSNN